MRCKAGRRNHSSLSAMMVENLEAVLDVEYTDRQNTIFVVSERSETHQFFSLSLLNLIIWAHQCCQKFPISMMRIYCSEAFTDTELFRSHRSVLKKCLPNQYIVSCRELDQHIESSVQHTVTYHHLTGLPCHPMAYVHCARWSAITFLLVKMMWPPIFLDYGLNHLISNEKSLSLSLAQ